MDTVVTICVLVCSIFALVVWFYTGSHKRKTIKEITSKTELTKPTDVANMSATTYKKGVFLPSLQKPAEETALSATLHKRSVSQPRDSTSVTSKGNEGETGSDEVVCNANNEEKSGNESREDFGNIEFDKFLSFVQLDVLRSEMTKAGNAHGLNQYIRDSLDEWKEMELNVAVTGNSGVGKSSLINALRKLKPKDKNAAEVDVVETTTEAKKYTYPENERVALWDLPGIGTQAFTKDKYLGDMDFSRFDVVIIVSAGRFLENDMWLGKKLLDLRKNILFVRTKIDFDIMNAERDHPNDFSKANCTAKIRNNLTKNIRDGGIPNLVSGIYLVSSPYRALYDFAQLDEKLKGLLSIKGKAIRALLEKCVVQAIRADQASYKDAFKFRKAFSVIYGFLPIPNLETGLGNMSVSSIRELCLKKFCIADPSLDKIAGELCVSKAVLKESLKSYGTSDEGTLLTSTEGRIWSTFRKYSKYIVPVLGMFLSAHKTYLTLQECLKTMYDQMAEDELILVRKRLDRLEAELKPL